MRETLRGCKPNKFYTFEGTVQGLQYEKYLICNISVYENGRYLGKVNHCLIAKKPFRIANVIPKGKVTFTGKVFKYYRSNGTSDFGIKVNKVKKSVF